MQKVENQRIGAHCMLSCLYFLLLPTTIAVNSAGNSILKLATVPIGLFFVVTLILSNRKLQINGVHLALLLYTLSAISTLFVSASANAMDFAIGYVLNAALYICLSVIPYNKAELDLMEKVQIVLMVILNVMTLLSGGTRGNRTTLMIMGQVSDPNLFVGFFVFPLVIALKQLVSGRYRIFYLLLIAVSMYSIFLSGSRGGFLAIVVTIVGFAVLYPSGFAKRIRVLVGGLILLLILWAVFKPVLPENIVERMSVEAVLETGGTGRLDIWSSMIREIVNQPDKLFIGRGLDARHKTFLGNVWIHAYAHNQLLQVTYNQGLIGLISFLGLTGISFFRCIRRRKTVAIAILGMVALSMSLSFNQTARNFWNLIAYAAFAFPDSDTNTIDNGGIDNECD